MEITQYIDENNKRKERFDAPYNPWLGIGSYIERFELALKNPFHGTTFLPMAMLDMPLVQEALKKKDVSNEHYSKILGLRSLHDYEYYAITHQHIRHKTLGLITPFKLNYAQRAIVLPSIESQRLAGEPMRQIFPKARQGGISTFINGINDWIQFRKPGWNSCIVTLVEDQARNIRSMYTTIAKHHPIKTTLIGFEGGSKNKYCVERECLISIGSVESPDALRSGDIKIAHLSECGLWKKTQGKSPEDLIQSIRGTIPEIPDTFIALESTAKGVGNFFHREHLSSLKPDSSYKSCFIAWWNMEQYQQAVPNNELESFISSWDDYEHYLWELGATIEGIKWYRNKFKNEFKGDKWRMMSEFPSTDTEAFTSTGANYFPRQYTQPYYKWIRQPQFVGDLPSDNLGSSACFENIVFTDNVNGNLFVWDKPAEKQYKNRYIVIMDIGGKNEKADYSVITVMDRYYTTMNDALLVVARMRIHLDYDLAAWKAAQIATWYQNALLVIESNFVDNKHENTEGDNFLSIIDVIAEEYDNMYTRTSPERIRDGVPAVYGFHMNRKSKPMIFSTLTTYLRGRMIDEPDERAVDEAEQFEIKPDGTLGAVDGCHDDILVTDAIGTWVHEQMDPCTEAVIRTINPNRNTSVGESSF